MAAAIYRPGKVASACAPSNAGRRRGRVGLDLESGSRAGWRWKEGMTGGPRLSVREREEERDAGWAAGAGPCWAAAEREEKGKERWEKRWAGPRERKEREKVFPFSFSFSNPFKHLNSNEFEFNQTKECSSMDAT